jgi:hypothetical protein
MDGTCNRVAESAAGARGAAIFNALNANPILNQTNVYGPSLGNVLAILMVRLGVNLEYPRTSSVPPEPRRGPKRRNGRPRSERNRVRD